MEDEIEYRKENSHTSYSSQSSSPIIIPSRPSRPASPFPQYMSKMSLRGAPSLPIESIESSSIQYSSPTKPSITDTMDDFSTPETKKRDSTFYQSLSIHINQPVGSMSISPTSRDVVLATRKGLVIIDLEDPYEPPRELHHLTKWEVADVQWNPHQSHHKWVASTSNQKGLIWNLESTIAVEHILHAHNRAISDINWHPLRPDLLATCSVDTYVNLWDLRKPRRPTRSFCAWSAGATQVKFNKKDEFLLASAHDKDLLIWDTRKGSLPMTKTTAHKTKIYGIDWSRSSADNIITCSLDKSVKFWNIQELDTCQGVIHTNSPVWRARHSPVGNGILTMPQRSEYKLYLWNQNNPQNHVHVFEGHNDVVKEFVWRVKSDGDPMIDDREFQLITWSKDRYLRLWPINDKLLKLIGHERGNPICPTDQFKPTGQSTFTFRDPPANNHLISPTLSTSTSYSSLRIIPGNRTSTKAILRPSGASTGGGNIKDYMGANWMFKSERRSLSHSSWMQNVKMIRPSGEVGNTEDIPTNMKEEWAAVSAKFPNVKFEEFNSQGRICTISLHGPSDSGFAFIRIKITFPLKYPDKAPPIFDIQKAGMISIMNRTHMLKVLKDIARSHVAQKRPCLEACIRYLLGEHTQEDGQERYGRDDSDDENYINAARRTSYDKSLIYILGDKDDGNTPFPKLCGAKFCATGKLVCFFSSLRSAKSSSDNREKSSYTYNHPRSFESWEQYKMMSLLPRSITRADDDDYALPLHLYLRREPDIVIPYDEISNLDRAGYDIRIYDFSEWMPINRKLAKEYILRGDDPVEICKYNAQVAADNNRPDLKQAWLLASLILCQTVSIKRIRNSLTSDEIIPTERSIGKYTNKRRESGYDSFIEWSNLNWGFHPYGRTLVNDLLNHFSLIGDIQTAAMLSCVFRQPFPPYQRNVRIQPLTTPESMTGNISSNTDYFNFYTRYPEKRNPNQYNLSGTFGESFSSSKSSLGNYYSQTDIFSLANGATPPTPSGYLYGSEGAGRSIMVPHTSNHQRRSTFGGTSKEFSSSISTTASPPRTPRKDSPSTSGFTSKFDGWVGYHGNEKFIETLSRPEKKSCGLRLVPYNLEEFDDEKRPFRSLLDDNIETNVRHDQFRLAYAELLYHWGLFEARAELLKFMRFVNTTVGSPLGERQDPLEIDIHCFQCKSELKGTRMCRTCNRKRVGIKCSICRQTVRGLSNFCMICSHGGHTNHLRKWFEENNECPSGCGCQCIIINGGF